MQIQINDTSSEKRALHIAVGASLLALLFYLWFTGWFSATVSLPMPVQEDGRLSVNYSWFAQTAGDALAFLGALTIAISSGLAKFGVQVVAFFARIAFALSLDAPHAQNATKPANTMMK